MYSLLFLLACGTPPANKPDADAEESWPSSPELEAHMMGHLDSVGRIWAALEQGELDEAHQVNQAFLEHEVAFHLPGDWIERVSAMGEAAVGLREAKDVPSASRRAAELASTCGDCHTQVKVLETLPAPPIAEGHAGSRGRLAMLQYTLIFPQTHSWEEASKALADAARKDEQVDESWVTLADRAVRIVPSARIEMAAELLTACAGCHAQAAAK